MSEISLSKFYQKKKEEKRCKVKSQRWKKVVYIFGRIKNDNKNKIRISFRFTRQKKVEEINHRSLIKKKKFCCTYKLVKENFG